MCGGEWLRRCGCGVRESKEDERRGTETAEAGGRR